MSTGASLETTSIAEQLQKTVASGELTLPPLPEAVVRLQAMLRDEDADTRALGGVIANEPALTASVLRVANSAAYGGLSRVETPQDAIARLGMVQVGAMVTAVAHKGHFSSENPARRDMLQALWRHAVATATGARMLAAQADGNTSEAFLGGLLHDIGKLVVLKGLDTMESRSGRKFTSPIVAELVHLLHAPLGHAVLTKWKVARPVCDVAKHHHEPDPPDSDVLLIRVQAANRISRKIGAHPEPDPELDLMALPEIERLALSELEIAALAVEIEDELAKALQIL